MQNPICSGASLVIKPSAHPSRHAQTASRVFYKRKLAPQKKLVKSFSMRRTPVGRDKVSRRYSLSSTSPALKLTRKPRFIIYARGTPRLADLLLAGVLLIKRTRGGEQASRLLFKVTTADYSPFKNLLLVE
jgi:hypothetical protein